MEKRVFYKQDLKLLKKMVDFSTLEGEKLTVKTRLQNTLQNYMRRKET